MESTITDKLAEMLATAPPQAAVVDMQLHHAPVTVTYAPGH
ncbi:hypothetical protein [Citricoccus sp. SGAir0253]|nr:hypothetical protein [Citricoccus sp. SGAir0253]